MSILTLSHSQLPFTSFTFAQTIILSKEILSIKTGDFFSWVNVTQDFYASGVSPSGHKLQDFENITKNFICVG